MTRRLTDEEIERQLGDLPDWTRDDDTIRASFEAPDFLTGIALVQEVASAAETMDNQRDGSHKNFSRLGCVYHSFAMAL